MLHAIGLFAGRLFAAAIAIKLLIVMFAADSVRRLLGRSPPTAETNISRMFNYDDMVVTRSTGW